MTDVPSITDHLLAMPPRTIGNSEIIDPKIWGANQFRAEVHSLIASALGGGGE